MQTLLPELEEQTDVATESTWSLLALNDNETPAILVIFGLMAIGLTKEDAVAKTKQIDAQDSAFVAKGLTKEDAMNKKDILVQITMDGNRIGWHKPLPGLDVSIIQDS